MDKFVISGQKPLRGSIAADGSKNAALPIILGALLIDSGETTIRNVPPLRDIYTAIEVMKYLGAKIEYRADDGVLTINAEHLTEHTVPYDLMRQMRASFLVLGPLISRMGKARISLPGGCSLGARPVDFHIKAFAGMGAKISEEAGYIMAEAAPLAGGQIYTDRPTHTGTENIMYGGIFASGPTDLINAACDPEIVDVANFLNAAGAGIEGAGTPHLRINPVKKLKPVDYTVAGDRLVAGTYLIGAAMTGGKVTVTGINPSDLTVVNHKLVEMGCEVESTEDSVTLSAPARLAPTNITTFPFPGFPTDLQACIMSATGIASGTSHITETVFKDRFTHTMELRRLGADISVAGSEAVVHGVDHLQGAEVMASDIRAGAGLVLACLAAKGRSEILRVYHIDRGYDRLEEKLSSLGADIKRIKD